MTLKMYIAVLSDVPDYITPTLVAHAVLRHHLISCRLDYSPIGYALYDNWLTDSFRKCVIRVNQKEFDKIKELPYTVQSWENNTLGGVPSCVTIVIDTEVDFPKVLRFAKLWKPIT